MKYIRGFVWLSVVILMVTTLSSCTRKNDATTDAAITVAPSVDTPAVDPPAPLTQGSDQGLTEVNPRPVSLSRGGDNVLTQADALPFNPIVISINPTPRPQREREDAATAAPIIYYAPEVEEITEPPIVSLSAAAYGAKPLDDAAQNYLPGSDVSFSGVSARQDAETQVCGALMVNISSGGLAVESSQFTFYVNGSNNNFLSRIKKNGVDEIIDATHAFALQINGGQLMYYDEDGSVFSLDEKTNRGGVIVSNDRVDAMARIGTSVFYSGKSGSEEGIYRIDTKAKRVQKIYSGSALFLVDALKKQLVVQTGSGVVLMDTSGKIVQTQYNLPVSGFTLVGDKLLIIDQSLQVYAVANQTAQSLNIGTVLWVGAYSNRLYFIDEYRRLQVADLNGQNARVLLDGPVFSPTFIGKEVWYSTSPFDGITNKAANT